MDDSDLVSTAEAADLLGMRVRTVQRRAKEGRLPVAQKLPGTTGAYLFNKQVIELLRGGVR